MKYEILVDVDSWRKRYHDIKDYLYPNKKYPEIYKAHENMHKFIDVLIWLDHIKDKDDLVKKNMYYILAVENYLQCIERSIDESKKKVRFADKVFQQLTGSEDLSILLENMKNANRKDDE